VFSLAKPTAAAIELKIAAANHLLPASPGFLTASGGLKVQQLPVFFAHDFSESVVGQGQTVFSRARRAFEHWEMFDLGWVRIVNVTAAIAVGQIVGVEAYTLGLWSLNLTRILEVVDTRYSFGFLYATTELHVENGEERFMLEFDPVSSQVRYILEAVSRPRNALAQLGLPITRAFQRRFAQDSHRRMREAATRQDNGDK
jgi:uncharacterized protein (UPF0548 family)